MNPRTPPRDPALLPRLSLTVLALAVLWPMLLLAEFNPAALFDAKNLKVMRHFLATFLPPDFSPDFLQLIATATLETLAIATAGIALAMCLGVPLALIATRSLSLSQIAMRADSRRWQGSDALRWAGRGVLMLLRGIPEIVWALLLVRALGLGPAAGVLALAITYSGMLGKVYAEILESGDARPTLALLESGSGRLAALGYGLLPGVLRELTSYTVYRWECAVRASIIMGFVGAGGLGQLMELSMRMLNGGEVVTIFITFLLMVMLADGISHVLRKMT